MRPLPDAPARDWKPSSVNGIEVWSSPASGGDRETMDVPSLQVQLAASGSGRSILATVGRSSLDTVLALRHAVPVPSSWKPVRFDGLQVQVPAGWPIQVLDNHVAEPGMCPGPIFRKPTAFLDDKGFRSICAVAAQQLVPPVDGVWLAPAPLSQSRTHSQVLPFGPSPALLISSDTEAQAVIGVRVTVGTRTLDVAIGLGADPTVAEEILSSLQASRLPPSTATPTTLGSTSETTRPGPTVAPATPRG